MDPVTGRRGLARVALVVALAAAATAMTATMAAPTAAAEPAPPAVASASVRWRAPAGCPDEAALRARLDARLPRPLGAGDTLDATITVARTGRRLRARVVVWTPVADVDRELVAGRCDELADAVAVVLARAVAEARALAPVAPLAPTSPVAAPPDDGNVMASMEPRRPADLERPPSPAPPRPGRAGRRASPPPPPPPTVPRARIDGGLRPALVSGAGITPKVGAGLELGLWLVRDTLALEVVGTRWLERLAGLPASQRFGAAVGLDALAVRACWQPDRYGPRVCALGEVGTMTGRGVGLFDARVGEGPYSAAGVGVLLRARLREHVALVGGFDMLRAIDRPRFVLDRGTVLFQPDPLAGRVRLGVEVGWR